MASSYRVNDENGWLPPDERTSGGLGDRVKPKINLYLPVGKIKASRREEKILSHTATSAAERILDVAERLAQTRGFNGFSYADIAAELSVTKASLHYHFASKADLGRALIVRYRVVFGRALDAIDGEGRSAWNKLRHYVALYDSVMRDDRMCLCGMFAAEYATLPAPMRQELQRFFDTSEQWLTAVLDDGRRTGELSFWDPPQERARVFLGALEGVMLVARSYEDDRRFRVAAEHLLADLKATTQPGMSARRRKSKPRGAT